MLFLEPHPGSAQSPSSGSWILLGSKQLDSIRGRPLASRYFTSLSASRRAHSCILEEATVGGEVREPHWMSIAHLTSPFPNVAGTGFLVDTQSTSTLSHSLGHPVPVVRQINQKGGAKDQDNGEAKEKDSSHVPEVHNRVPVVSMAVWVLWRRKSQQGLPAAPQCIPLACINLPFLTKFFFHLTLTTGPLYLLFPLPGRQPCSQN